MFNHDHVQDMVIQPGPRDSEIEEAAKYRRIDDRQMDQFDMLGVPILFDVTFEYWALTQGASRRHGIAEASQPSAKVGSRREFCKGHVESSRGRVDEVPPSLTVGGQPTGVDAGDATVPEKINRTLDIAGNVDRPREVVRRPERKDAQDGVASDERIRDAADRSIAAGRNHDRLWAAGRTQQGWQDLEVLDAQFVDDLEVCGCDRPACPLDLFMAARIGIDDKDELPGLGTLVIAKRRRTSPPSPASVDDGTAGESHPRADRRTGDHIEGIVNSQMNSRIGNGCGEGEDRRSQFGILQADGSGEGKRGG